MDRGYPFIPVFQASYYLLQPLLESIVGSREQSSDPVPSFMDSAKPIIAALKRQASEHVPIWLMRQAGRYLPEYRAVRARTGSFLELCFTPELAVEVTLQPIRRFPLDAAIIFSDILVVPHALGQAVRFEEGQGPLLEPIRSAEQVRSLSLDRLATSLAPVATAIAAVRRELPASVALF